MGLDVSWYRGLVLVPGLEWTEETEEGLYDTHFMGGSGMEWSESVWPGRGAPLDPKAVYTFAESGGFHADSYSGHGAFRQHLNEVASTIDDLANDITPFYELTNFADNEGVIGPIVSAKLAKDFEQYREHFVDMGDWFLEKYDAWHKAFVMASDNGAVVFH